MADIPKDYNREMGVPTTYLTKHNPEQFEIVGADFELAQPLKLKDGKMGTGRFYENGNRLFQRLIIKRKKQMQKGK